MLLSHSGTHASSVRCCALPLGRRLLLRTLGIQGRNRSKCKITNSFYKPGPNVANNHSNYSPRARAQSGGHPTSLKAGERSRSVSLGRKGRDVVSTRHCHCRHYSLLNLSFSFPSRINFKSPTTSMFNATKPLLTSLTSSFLTRTSTAASRRQSWSSAVSPHVYHLHSCRNSPSIRRILPLKLPFLYSFSDSPLCARWVYHRMENKVLPIENLPVFTSLTSGCTLISTLRSSESETVLRPLTHQFCLYSLTSPTLNTFYLPAP